MIHFSGLVNFPFFSIVPDYQSRVFMQLQEIKDLVLNRNLTSERASILQQCNEYEEFINLEERLNNEQEKMDVVSSMIMKNVASSFSFHQEIVYILISCIVYLSI